MGRRRPRGCRVHAGQQRTRQPAADPWGGSAAGTVPPPGRPAGRRTPLHRSTPPGRHPSRRSTSPRSAADPLPGAPQAAAGTRLRADAGSTTDQQPTTQRLLGAGGSRPDPHRWSTAFSGVLSVRCSIPRLESQRLAHLDVADAEVAPSGRPDVTGLIDVGPLPPVAGPERAEAFAARRATLSPTNRSPRRRSVTCSPPSAAPTPPAAWRHCTTSLSPSRAMGSPRRSARALLGPHPGTPPPVADGRGRAGPVRRLGVRPGRRTGSAVADGPTAGPSGCPSASAGDGTPGIRAGRGPGPGRPGDGGPWPRRAVRVRPVRVTDVQVSQGVAGIEGERRIRGFIAPRGRSGPACWRPCSENRGLRGWRDRLRGASAGCRGGPGGQVRHAGFPERPPRPSDSCSVG